MSVLTLDAVADYSALHAQLIAARKKLAEGDRLIVRRARPNLGEAALRDVLPLSQCEDDPRGERVYTHAPVVLGEWRTAEPSAGRAIVHLPFVNREDLLERAYHSVAERLPVMIIDQSRDGIDPGRYPHAAVYRCERQPLFSVMMNWAHHYARARGYGFICFMHSDAECIGDAATVAVDAAAADPRAALTLTNYDAFGVYNLEVLSHIGCFDETFVWYTLDSDYFHRIRRKGFEIPTAQGTDVVHHLSQTLSSYERRSDASRGTAEHRHAFAQYVLKWGGDAEHERFSVPYDNGDFVLAPKRRLYYRDPRPCGVTDVPWSRLRERLQTLPAREENEHGDGFRRDLSAAQQALDAGLGAYVSSHCARCPIGTALGRPPPAPEAAEFEAFRRELSVHFIAKKMRPQCLLFNCAVNKRLHSGEAYVWRETLGNQGLPEKETTAVGRCGFLHASGCALKAAPRAPSCVEPRCEEASRLGATEALAALEETFADYRAAHEAVQVYAADVDPELPFGLEAIIE